MAITTPAIYVACIGDYGSEESYVNALDPSDLSVKDQITLAAADATRLAMRPDGYRLWVSHYGANLITVLQANTFEIMDTIDFDDVIHNPYQMAIRTPGSLMFPQLILACPNVNKIYVYNMYTHRQLYELDVDSERLDVITEDEEDTVPPLHDYVKLTPDGRYLYTYSSAQPPHRDNIVVFDLGNEYNLHHVSQIGEICLEAECSNPPSEPLFELQESVFNPEGTRLYIANRRTDRIEVVDTTVNVYLNPIRVEGLTHPRSVAISPTGNYLYIGYVQSFSEDGEILPGYIVMFNLEDETVAHTVEIPNNPRTMVLNPSGDRLFVAEHGSHEIYAFDIDVESEAPLSLAATVNLDSLVTSGYASPVEILYLERRPLLPVSPYVVVVIENIIFAPFRRLWSVFFRPLFGFFNKIFIRIFSGMKQQ